VRCHRGGEDHLLRIRGSCNLARGVGGRAGGDAVVDDDALCEQGARPACPVAACSAFEFDPLQGLDVRQFVGCAAGHSYDFVVELAPAVLADSAYAEFRLEWAPSLRTRITSSGAGPKVSDQSQTERVGVRDVGDFVCRNRVDRGGPIEPDVLVELMGERGLEVVALQFGFGAIVGSEGPRRGRRQ
jgi:hypothetical protein